MPVIPNLPSRSRIETRIVVVSKAKASIARAPSSQVPAEFWSTTESPFLAVINIQRTMKVGAPKPIVGSKQIGPIKAAIAWRKHPVVRMSNETAVVVREKHDRHIANKQRRVASFDSLAFNNFNRASADFISRIGNVIGR